MKCQKCGADNADVYKNSSDELAWMVYLCRTCYEQILSKGVRDVDIRRGEKNARSDERIVAHVNAVSVMVFAEIRAMIAENRRRIDLGKSQAYGEAEFLAVRSEVERVLKKYNIG